MIPLRQLLSVAAGVAAGALSVASTARADIECWAPGMPASVFITSTSRYQTASLGTPYRYDVYGVGGALTLGNQASGAVVSGGFFKQSLAGIPVGGAVNSTATMQLQTGALSLYPQSLSLSGNQPGITMAPVQNYGTDWTLCDPKHPAAVNLTFHTAGSTLLTALLPGVLSPAYYNINPSGNFFVMGEYHAAPPVMSGVLTFPAASVMAGTQTTVNFTVTKDDKPVYRPPFLAVDLGSVNLTLLGTPPVTSPASSGKSPVYTTNADQVVATVNLTSGTSGNGWTRITLGL